MRPSKSSSRQLPHVSGAPGVPIVVVTVVEPGRLEVVVVESARGVTVSAKGPCSPAKPSTKMKYVVPADTGTVRKDACPPPGQPSSRHPVRIPVKHALARTYTTLSNFVAWSHVEIVANPEIEGVHWKTRSGA